MRKVQITCTSSFPLMMDQMPSAVLDSLATKVKIQVKTDVSDHDVANEKIYRENDQPNGRIGLPVTMLYAALVVAGREVAYKGRTMISTATTTKLFGLIEIPHEFLPFPIPEGQQETPWVIDKRRGILKSGTTEVAVCLRRPKFPQWGFTCEVIYNDDDINESTVRKLFELAGRFQGLGSFRPNCKGPFGRFTVSKMVDITPEEWIKASKNKKKPVEDEPVELENETGNGDLDLADAEGNGKSTPTRRKNRLTEAQA